METIVVDIDVVKTVTADIVKEKDMEVLVEKPTVIKEEFLPHYEGEYEFSPSLFDIDVQTRNKVLDRNIKLKQVPHYEVSTPEGDGTVFYIGE